MNQSVSFEHLRTKLDYLSAPDQALVAEAYQLAAEAHGNQMRKSGEPYISHPLWTASYLADYRLDAATLEAALLHDVLEDTPVTLDQIRGEFGKEVAQLVDGVTKLSQIRLKKSWRSFYRLGHPQHGGTSFEAFDRHVETLRKMFLAMSRDLRVVLIKLADRLHNLQTVEALTPERRQRLAQETLEVYAPLANRLGIGQLRGQLEDLAFPFALPDEYTWVKNAVGDEYRRRARYIEQVRRVLLKRLVAQGIQAEAHGRAKHLYSLWKKLLRQDRNLEKIYDLVAVRVIVPTVEDCYRVLGLIHAMWKPLPGRIKDYVATPKPNGYQSLHTTVFARGGKITEIQIRTPEMHRWAEYGIAAHWAYKEQPDRPRALRHRWDRSGPRPSGKLSWIQELATLEEQLHDPAEWRKGLALDFFSDRIFIYTPEGDVLDLPAGATPIDVAFAIHSDVGRHCAGAKVSGKLVPLSHPLENGDIVEIMTQAKTTPKRDWLQFARTNRARSLIKRTLHLPTEVAATGGQR